MRHWAVKIRVYRKTKKNKYYPFVVHMRGDCEMKATFKYFDFFERIITGRVYLISGAEIRETNPKYSANNYEMILKTGTYMSPCDDDGSIPQMQFKLLRISEVFAQHEDAFVDVLAIAAIVGDLFDESERTKKPYQRRRSKLWDTSGEIDLMLWGDHAKNFAGTPGAVLLIKEARVHFYNGVLQNLNLDDDTVDFIPNDDVDHAYRREAEELRGYFAKTKYV